MPLNDYEVADDKFEADAQGWLSFPCCVCCWQNKKDNEQPCCYCGHNANRVRTVPTEEGRQS